MPSIWKRFSKPNVSPFPFLDTEELREEGDEGFTELVPEEADPAAVFHPGGQPPEEPEPEPEPEPEEGTLAYAEIQADKLLKEAGRRAQELVAEAEREAKENAALIAERARAEGYAAGHAEGYAAGTAQAIEEGRQATERQAEQMIREVEQFLDRAAAALDRQLDSQVDEMKDLALAVAEKIVAVSLKSSGEVISRMIQTAIDKHKRREWAHIYISATDARRLTPLPPALATALGALSDRVRIIPMDEDEAGTCIIEMPDEIIDASAATQMNNIKNLISDLPTDSAGGFELTGGPGRFVP